MLPKWTGSELEVTGSGPEVDQKWTGCVHLSVRTFVHPKHFPYLLDEPYVRDLHEQGACAVRFLYNSAEIIKFEVLSRAENFGFRKILSMLS